MALDTFSDIPFICSFQLDCCLHEHKDIWSLLQHSGHYQRFLVVIHLQHFSSNSLLSIWCFDLVAIHIDCSLLTFREHLLTFNQESRLERSLLIASLNQEILFDLKKASIISIQGHSLALDCIWEIIDVDQNEEWFQI